MYSRSQWREPSRTDYDESYYSDDISEEEYELYRYNLPPKYDGSRFRRSAVCRGQREHTSSEAKDILTVPVIEEAPEMCCSEEQSESEQCEKLSSYGENKAADGGVQKLMQKIGDRLGYEEIVIIALILMIAGDGKANGDIILLLALLLLEN